MPLCSAPQKNSAPQKIPKNDHFWVWRAVAFGGLDVAGQGSPGSKNCLWKGPLFNRCLIEWRQNQIDPSIYEPYIILIHQIILDKNACNPVSLASIWTEIFLSNFKNRANLSEISMARLALIPLLDRKNTIRFVIYAKKLLLGANLHQDPRKFLRRTK